MSTSLLGADALAETMRVFAGALSSAAPTLNRLNVFPVPDGDTGTNMSLTMDSVVGALDALDGASGDLAATGRAIGHGSLMGARGNSGVILCQVLRAFSDAVVAGGRAAPEVLGEALAAAGTAARAAVQRPVEGTILSVAEAAGTAALAAASTGADLAGVAKAARAASVVALWRTPEQLPVLAEAGVVDAGGAGLTLLYDALVAVLTGAPGATALALPLDVAALVGGDALGHVTIEAVRELPGAGSSLGEVGDLRYEVMYLLEAPDESVPAFREVWAGIGDSIVVVGGDGLWNCHIHTDDVGAAVEAALDVGRPRRIRVSDLAEQAMEERWVREAAAASGAGEPGAPAGPAPTTAVVAVAVGDGVGRIFGSLGAGHLVSGGQTMNPSTAEILAVLDALESPEAVVLPNNANIIAVAEQAAALATARVRVVATRGIQEGFAALIEYDPMAGAEENAAAMAAAAARITAGEVTQAVRASSSSAGAIEPGDFIGVARDGGIVAVANDVAAATIGLIEALVEPRHELVTLIEGAGSSPAATRRVEEWLTAEHPGVAIERHRGGQPLYPYLVSIE